MNVLRYNCRYMINNSGIPRTMFCETMGANDSNVGYFMSEAAELKTVLVEKNKSALMTIYFIKYILEQNPFVELKVSESIIFERFMKFKKSGKIIGIRESE